MPSVGVGFLRGQSRHVRGPVRLGAHSEPQPDLLALEPRDDFYQSKPPAGDDVLLLIEVADSSLQYDQAVKLPLYARAGLREVWLVDLVRNEVQVHREPTPGGFGFVERRRRGASVEPIAFPGLSLRVDDLLG